jgi:tetratricopeptide (TPR) repeat protein
MKPWALLLLGVIACGGAAPAQRAGGPPTGAAPAVGKHPEMLALMERYLESPLDGEGDDLKKIHDFVEQNHDVTVTIDRIALPFLEEDLDDGVKSVVLIGFLAGNAAAQLRAGVKRDDVVAGVEGELAVYLILKAQSTTLLKDRKVVSPSLDALLEVRARGQLRAYLERTRARRDSGDGNDGNDGNDAPAPGAAGPSAAPSGPANDSASKDADSEQARLVAEAMQLVQSGHPGDAIANQLDKVIAGFEKQYAGDKRHIYCAHGQAEALHYMMEAANRGEQAVALDGTWADAWYVKSFALTELHRTAEAISALDKAIALSPSHPHYLSERGYLYQQAKDWPHALEWFKAAEESVKLLASGDVQQHEHTRALRGQGYALVELGDLDAAAQRYEHSLALDPDDKTSRQELEYIKDLQAKRK